MRDKNNNQNGGGNMKAINRIYPGCKIIACSQLFVEGVGWYSAIIHDPADIKKIARAGRDLAGRKIIKMAILIEHDGMRRQADFSPKELR